VPALTVPSPAELQAVENPQLTVPGLIVPRDPKPPHDLLYPYPYQKVDATYMLLYPRSLIAEYPAAGKKLITIMAILKAFSLFKARNALILSLGSDVVQWQEEFELWTEGVSTQVYRGSPKERANLIEHDPDVRIATYQTARNDVLSLINRHDILVADEVSILKNTDTDLHPHIRALFAPTFQEQANALREIHEKRRCSIITVSTRPGRTFVTVTP